jgi:hypothetical protein
LRIKALGLELDADTRYEVVCGDSVLTHLVEDENITANLNGVDYKAIN